MNIAATSTELLSFLLQANQQVIDRYDSLIGTMSMIATIFGVILGISIAQDFLNRSKITKEIQEYKNGVKRAAKNAQQSAQKISNLLSETEKRNIQGVRYLHLQIWIIRPARSVFMEVLSRILQQKPVRNAGCNIRINLI